MPVARTLGIELIPIELRSAADLDRGFDIAVRERTQVLLAHLGVWPHRARILAFAQRNELPLVASTRELAPLGALITYGPDVRAHLRRAASYVVRILRGMHPGELPIEQPDKFELVINLKTAKVLGITIPPSLLARADEVIE
jgi:putative ABC transport system substrate-binding protein